MAGPPIVTDILPDREVVEVVRRLAPGGIDHAIEVAFHAHVAMDEELLFLIGWIATYATNDPSASIPFWPLVFKNARLFFHGTDDFPAEVKTAAA